MIYKHRFIKRIPKCFLINLCKEVIGDPEHRHTYHKSFTKRDEYWKQYDFNDSHQKILIDKLVVSSKIKVVRIRHVVLHQIHLSVETHRDEICKSTVLIPVKFCKSITFYDEDRSINFEHGCYYVFNDFELHGLEVPRYSNNLIISIDFE